MTAEKIDAFFRRWVPVWVVASWAIALVLRFLAVDWAWIGYILAGATGFATLMAALFAFSSPQTMRSRMQLGFERERDYWAYYFSGTGVSSSFYLLGFGSAIVAFVTRVGSGPGLLAIANLFLVLVFGWMTTKWPADDPNPGTDS